MNYLALIATLDQWIAANPDISSAAMIGSYVRQHQGAEPDIDITIVCATPGSYHNPENWLTSLFTGAYALQSNSYEDSLAVRFRLDQLTIELNFSSLQWARVPATAETAAVVRAGLTPLKDDQGLLQRLQQAVSDSNVISLRNAEITDAPQLADVFYRAVHAIAEQDYRTEEKQAWAPEPDEDNKRRWQQRIVDQKPFVALLGDQLAGFVSIDPNGLIDLLYVDPDLQNKGIGNALYRQVVNEALSFGLKELSVNASKAAQTFFAARGFNDVQNTQTSRNGVVLEWAQMYKTIAPA